MDSNPDSVVVELQAFMQEIAGLAYSGAQPEHLEFALWYAIVNGPMDYGQYSVTTEDIARLRALSQQCGHWLMWEASGVCRAVPLARWQDLFTQNVDLVQMLDP